MPQISPVDSLAASWYAVIMESVQHLISLPPRMAAELPVLNPGFAAEWFATSDPVGSKLGSGGGTAHLLTAAWRATGAGQSFTEWLRASCKLMIHAGGQSRRLPAYAAVGKAFIPLPAMRWAVGQRLEQTLVDLQVPAYRQMQAAAGSGYVAMVTSGDVLLRFAGTLPAAPQVDVLAVGLWAMPERAAHHGVFFCSRQHPDQLAFALQKPTPETIRELSQEYLSLIDTGVWLLSERAVLALLKKCGWDAARQEFASGTPRAYEFYAAMSLALGTHPRQTDPELAGLSAAVLPLPQGEFYHFGRNCDLIESVGALQHVVLDQTKVGAIGPKSQPDVHTLNAVTEVRLGTALHGVWIENATVPASWTLTGDHVITGVPANSWKLTLPRGVCVDFVPVGEEDWCVRVYGKDDLFSGAIGQERTQWLGRPARDWFAARGIDAGIAPDTDLQFAPLFPVLKPAAITGELIEWLGSPPPVGAGDWWVKARRLSAAEIGEQINLRRLLGQQTEHLRRVLRPLAENHRHSVFYKLDLLATARTYAATSAELPTELGANEEPLKRVSDRMFRAAVRRARGAADWERDETAAFGMLRELILREMEVQPVTPVLSAQQDQIVWGRSPIRLDLAGGWTDTPPYCLQNGGQVLNVAVDLNGQPPIQVFARRSDTPELVVRSIDLGIEERVRTYEELQQFEQVGSGFTVAKAAFALAGFLPRFQPGGKHASLTDQLREFGGGIELSMLSAVPKGSGLGTSSILAATLLGTLSEFCGLRWGTNDLFRRTLALEQMLTTGGGWQDQAGGLLRGIKLVETSPGLDQKPTIRWLPGRFFSREYADQTVLLYYTGITRVAKEILKEIVRGMFLNSRTHLEILGDIGANAGRAADAIQREDWDALCGAVRRSWELNRRLDAGTNPPAVQAILDQVGDYLAAAKLLGAGGGGYLLMFAKDVTAGRRIREILTANPPNAGARFVGLSLSETGFQVTRS